MLPARSSRLWFAVAGLGVLAAAGLAAGWTWSSQEKNTTIARAITGGNPSRAPEILRRYGCAGCHSIPGIPGAEGQVGPSLAGIVHRVYIGGVATNTPDNLVRWIVSPQSFSPNSAMPASGITEAEARDVAAYLYAQ
jgi:cytochrome c2